MKNYTSQVDAERSIEQIEEMLVRAKAMNISKQYTDMRVTAILFTLKVPEAPAPLAIQLPANVDAVARVLSQGKKSGPTAKQKAQFAQRMRNQAERTAWRLMYDWLAVQLSLIEMRQADAAQVFLPFAWNGRQTFYEEIRSAGFVPLLGAPPAKGDE